MFNQQSFLTHLKSLSSYRALFYHLAKRNLSQRFKGSILGVLWLFVSPLLLISIYVFVFTCILSNPFSGASKYAHIASVILGLTVFNFVIEPLNIAPVLVVRNPSFVKKVVFPLELLCASEYIAALIQFLGCLVLLFAFMYCGGVALTLKTLWIFLILGSGLLMSMGFALILSAVGVFLRDIEQMIQHLTRILLYTGAIFYPPEKVPRGVWSVLKFNPIVHLVQQSRNVFLLNKNPDFIILFSMMIAGCSILLIGLYIFHRLKREFADLI